MKPTTEQIQQTIRLVKGRLKHPDMERPINRAIRQGYTETVDILTEKRETYAGIEFLDTQQGRAIAVLAVDYLLGDCTQQVLVNVPLKSQR